MFRDELYRRTFFRFMKYFIKFFIIRKKLKLINSILEKIMLFKIENIINLLC